MIKTTNRSLCIILCMTIFTSLFMSSCLEDECNNTRSFIQYQPIFISEGELRQDINVGEIRDLNNPGNINFYNGFILINERREGVHIINNENPESPQNIAFIEIPGNVDIAVKDGHLYADSYADLLTIDISDPTNAFITCRERDVFINKYPFWQGQGYLVDYEQLEMTIEIDCNDPNFGDDQFFRNDILFSDVDFDVSPNSSEDASGGAGGGVGIGGSLARFTIAKDHLYMINDWQISVYDLEQTSKPSFVNTVDVGWGIETLFPYKDNLFVGAADGMYIFDNTTPSAPFQQSKFEHARACDPVFVQGNIAYVTLRDGSACQSFTNQLDIVNVESLTNPVLIESHDMQHPHGLSVNADHLYICEGEHGLKVFDKTNLLDLDQKDHVKNLHVFDVIALSNDHIIVVGKDGLYQYDTSNKSDLQQISSIPVFRDL